MRLARIEEVVEAHRSRRRLAARLGPAGEELFADAFQVAVHWWTRMPDTTRWVQRAWAAGLGAREVRAAPLVIYPEAAELARAMLGFERIGQRDAVGRARWLKGMEKVMDDPARPAGRHRLVLAVGHNRIASGTGSLDQRSYLPWQLGMTAAEM
ncbi:hypothetical protein [Streptomyces halobius]|uniref:Uncharacterized protein n=1 Tax=Streptomyces halobius TaxID=2879846 RepID=A0ABY4LZX2_9ACTN|nr:hypothetical protein [Streptomyces halobius]UQA90513.1 hypothetical protein K9S39_00055 [Streptomyces halobius]UQA97563.1 hypothetical protein K9S39_41995 [Streptomyces halobius]